MIWKFNTQPVVTFTIPLVEVGTPLDFQISIEASQDMPDSYLFVTDATLAGLFQAKKTTDVTYIDIGGPYTSACGLGDIGNGETLVLDIRANPTLDAQEGYHLLQLCMGSGFSSIIIPPEGGEEFDSLTVWRDDPTVWQDDPEVWS
jgi:hypothetical protein